MENPASLTRLSICFVCQSGELEIKAALLAASIRQFHDASEVELIACYPMIDGVAEHPSLSAVSLFTLLTVEIRPIESPFGQDYLIGNKIAALGVSTQSRRTLFLDSDILCLAPLDLDGFNHGAIQIKPADLNTFAVNDSAWGYIYAKFGLELPADRFFTSFDSQYILPYFNAGAIAVSDNEEFASQWLNISRAIDSDDEVQNKRPWLDQISLPIAIASLSLKSDILSENQNFPAHLKTLSPEVMLCHYHWPKIILDEPVLLNLVASLSRKYASLKSMLETHADWAPIQSLVGREDDLTDISSQLEPNIVITGIPRSGTSLLCNLLNKVDDIVVLNEPEEIFSSLSQPMPSETLAVFYRSIRGRINAGLPLQNKVDAEGDITQDTGIVDERRSFSPEVARSDFILATKNPLAYMARLPHLVEHYAKEQMIVCIRHPYETICSWKRSFSHLENVLLENIPFSSDNDPYINEWQSEQWALIGAEQSLTVRRALLWRSLAHLTLKHRNHVQVLRYEDLVRSPQLALNNILSPWTGYQIGEDEVSHVSSHKKPCTLAEPEKRDIRRVCAEIAAQFNYQL